MSPSGPFLFKPSQNSSLIDVRAWDDSRKAAYEVCCKVWHLFNTFISSWASFIEAPTPADTRVNGWAVNAYIAMHLSGCGHGKNPHSIQSPTITGNEVGPQESCITPHMTLQGQKTLRLSALCTSKDKLRAIMEASVGGSYLSAVEHWGYKELPSSVCPWDV